MKSLTPELRELIGVPVVTSLDAFEIALTKFERGGSKRECMAALMAIGLPADAIRYLTEFPGRTMCVCQIDL
jgi:hypothetical protein